MAVGEGGVFTPNQLANAATRASASRDLGGAVLAVGGRQAPLERDLGA